MFPGYYTRDYFCSDVFLSLTSLLLLLNRFDFRHWHHRKPQQKKSATEENTAFIYREKEFLSKRMYKLNLQSSNTDDDVTARVKPTKN